MEEELLKKFQPEFSSDKYLNLFIYACRLTQTVNLNSNISSQDYSTEFFKWIKPKDARNDAGYVDVIKATTNRTYSYFEKWQSDGTPVKNDYAALCFSVSAKYRGNKKLEQFFAEFLHHWNTYRFKEQPKPDFATHKNEINELLKKYRLIQSSEHPFAAQLQRYLHPQSYKRTQLLSDIKEFIDTNDSGYVLIEGGAGMGKSWLTAYTAKTLYDTGEYQCVWHFNELTSGHNRSADFIRTLFIQLRDIYPYLDTKQLNYEYERVLNTNSGYGKFYQLMFDQLTYNKIFQADKLIIFIDALDEVGIDDPSRAGISNTLFLPESLIRNTFIIVTSGSFEKQRYIGKKLKIKLTMFEDYQKKDIESYIRQRSKEQDIVNWINRHNWKGNPTETFIQLILEKSYLNFISLNHILLNLDQLLTQDQIYTGLESFYENRLQRVCYDSCSSKHEVVLIFEAIYYFKPCGIDLIARYTGLDHTIIRSVCDSASTTGVLKGKAPTEIRAYSYSHDGFMKFMEKYEGRNFIRERQKRFLSVIKWYKESYSKCLEDEEIYERDIIFLANFYIQLKLVLLSDGVNIKPSKTISRALAKIKRELLSECQTERYKKVIRQFWGGI